MSTLEIHKPVSEDLRLALVCLAPGSSRPNASYSFSLYWTV